jgi:hypothetical protein
LRLFENWKEIDEKVVGPEEGLMPPKTKVFQVASQLWLLAWMWLTFVFIGLRVGSWEAH